jgi:hypothetical protein
MNSMGDVVVLPRKPSAWKRRSTHPRPWQRGSNVASAVLQTQSLYQRCKISSRMGFVKSELTNAEPRALLCSNIIWNRSNSRILKSPITGPLTRLISQRRTILNLRHFREIYSYDSSLEMPPSFKSQNQLGIFVASAKDESPQTPQIA